MSKQIEIRSDEEQPAQQQEPVAWRDPKNVDPGQGCTYDKTKHEKWPHIYTQPLYTSPPASKPLTDEQANDIMEKESWGPDAITLNHQLLRTIRRTEAAHGIYAPSELKENE